MATAPRRTSVKTSIQLQAFQARDFDTTKKIVFAATMSVFQDLGYILGTADLETGLITAASPTKLDSPLQAYPLIAVFLQPQSQRTRDVKATAFVEAKGEKRARVRLNFVNSTRTSTSQGMTGAYDKPIEEPQVYQDTFTKIQKAIFVRENTGG